MTTHKGRKFYGEVLSRCGKGNKVSKVRDALNQKSLKAALHYQVQDVPDEKKKNEMNNNNIVFCDICQKSISKSNYSRHIKTKRHLSKIEK